MFKRMTWGQDEDEIVIVVTTRDRRPCSKVDMRLVRNGDARPVEPPRVRLLCS